MKFEFLICRILSIIDSIHELPCPFIIVDSTYLGLNFLSSYAVDEDGYNQRDGKLPTSPSRGEQAFPFTSPLWPPLSSHTEHSKKSWSRMLAGKVLDCTKSERFHRNRLTFSKREGLPFSFRCPRTRSTQASPGYTRVSEIDIPQALYHGGSIPNQLAPILIRRTRNSESMQLQHEVMGPCYALVACWLQVLQISVLLPMYIKAK